MESGGKGQSTFRFFLYRPFSDLNFIWKAVVWIRNSQSCNYCYSLLRARTRTNILLQGHFSEWDFVCLSSTTKKRMYLHNEYKKITLKYEKNVQKDKKKTRNRSPFPHKTSNHQTQLKIFYPNFELNWLKGIFKTH